MKTVNSQVLRKTTDSMKKLIPLVVCSTAAFCLGTVSASAGYITPRVPPRASQPMAQAAIANSLPTAWTVFSPRDGGPGSLRYAIANAAPGDVIRFALRCPAVIALTNTLVIDQNLTVLGPGPGELTVMRSGAPNTPNFRVFDVEAGVVTLAGMTIRNGSAFSGTNIHDNLGGGILNRGNLTVSNCVITANSAPTTDWGPSASPSVSVGYGAGIFADQGSQLAIINSTVSDNQATGGGGALYTWYANSFAAGSTFSGNFAAVEGGALGLQGLVGTFQNCTISGNSTPPDGSGSAFLLITWPGESATFTFTACTIAQNLGCTNGACIIAGLDGNAGLTNYYLSTLVAANEGPNFFLDGNPVLQSLGNNLDSDGTLGLVNGANGDLVGTTASPLDAKLSPLQDNGGSTWTMALLPGSPALGAGACTDATGAPLTVDQRGFPRPQGTGCDIGAFENQAPTLTCPAAQTVPDCTPQNGTPATLTATVSDPDGDALVVIWSIGGAPAQTNYVNATHPPMSQNVSFTASYPKGTNLVGVVVSDGKAAPAGCSTSVIVRDLQPPKIFRITANPAQLWPPNGQLVAVRVMVCAAGDCGPVTSKIVSITSNEPPDSAAPDWIIIWDDTVLLRAERAPHGKERIYTITVACTDAAGNTSTGTVCVSVSRHGRGWFGPESR